MTTCGPEAAGSTTRDLIASASGTAGSRSKRIQGRSWHVCISAVATGFSWLTHPLTLGALKRKECVCKKSCKKTRESRKSAKINPTDPQEKTDKKNTEGIRREFGRHISRKSSTRNNKKSHKNSGENTGEKTGVPWNAKFASTFSRVFIVSSPKDDDASSSV